MDKWTSLERAEVLVQALPYIRAHGPKRRSRNAYAETEPKLL